MPRFLFALASALSLLWASAVCADTSWPANQRAIQIIVPSPAGVGLSDAIARMLAQGMAQDMGANFVVDNYGGANGNIGAGLAAQAHPDGSRLLLSWTQTLALSPALYKKLPFDPQNSFQMVGLVAEVPNILVVSPNFPANSIHDFTKYVSRHPSEVNFASTGNGSPMHLAGELYMSLTDTNMVHIPYSALGQATTNLMSGQIQAMFHLLPSIAGQVRAKQVKALAVTAKERSAALPEVPTAAEQGYPDLISTTWFALLAPSGTDPAIIETANASLNRVLSFPEVQAKLLSLGATALGGSPAEAELFLSIELEKWQGIVDGANLTVQ